MSTETKGESATRKKARLFNGAAWLDRLLIPRAWLCWGWLKQWFCTDKIVAKQRAAEKERQAGIRRELRGLPAEHDDGQSKKA